MQVVLVMFLAGGERRSFSVVRDVTVVGRREDCDMRIPLGDVSRKHCRFIRENDTLRVEDLGSSNGTYVNSQRVQEAPVAAGDLVQIGPVYFVVQIDGKPTEEELQAMSSGSAGSEDTQTVASPSADAEAVSLDGLDAPAAAAAPAGGDKPPADADEPIELDLDDLMAEAPAPSPEEPPARK